MIYLYHGSHSLKSRQALPPGALHYNLAELNPEKLAELLTGRSLFGPDQDVYLWSDKKLGAPALKKFPGVKVREFSLPRTLWQFLRSKKLTDLNQTLKSEPIELVWYLLHRQAAREGKTELLRQMLAIELAVKSGRSGVPLRTQLELLLS
jgi:hypothetical protein